MSQKLLALFLALSLTAIAPTAIALEPTQAAYDIARLRNDKALALANQGKYSEAIKLFEQSLAYYRTVGNPELEGIMLHSIGSMYRALEQRDQALTHFQQAVTILKTHGDLNWQSLSLRMLGSTYLDIGKYGDAITTYEQALAIDYKLNNKQRQGRSLNALGIIYANLGQYQKALTFHQKALPIFQALGDPEDIEKSISNMAAAQDNLGQHSAAIVNFKKAIALLDDRLKTQPESWRFHTQSQAEVLDSLGYAYVSNNQLDLAKTTYQQSLKAFQKLQLKAGQGRVLSHLGYVSLQQKRIDLALPLYEESLRLRRAVKDSTGIAYSLTNLAEVWLQQGKLAQAETALLEAISIWESQRPGLGDPDKISFFETVSETYSLLQQVLVQQNRPEAALEIAEKGRARALTERLTQRIDSTNSQPIIAPNLAAIRAIAQSHQATLVEYSFPTDYQIYIWVIPPTGSITFKSIKRRPTDTPLKQLVANSRSALGARGRASIQLVTGTNDFPTPAPNNLKQLHQLFIAPIHDHLPQDPNQPVIFLPQEELFLVPFAALQNPNGQFLIQQHTIAIAPSIQTLALTQKRQHKNPTGPALIVGDPTMPQIRDLNLPPLPGAREEAIAIGKLLNSPALIGAAATKAAILEKIGSARFVHLATHGLLEERVGEIPGAIALAPNGPNLSDQASGLFTANEIAQLNLTAELVVLSACDTGRGDISGEGVVGLSRSFVSAGVPTVVVSLWAVPDSPTRELMTAFYQNLQIGKLDKAQSLRQAMLETLKKHPNPLDWAAFTLIGETQ